MSFWKDVEVKKCRKEHRCEVCHGTIKVSDRCFHETGTFCGDFNDYYLCPRCRDILNSVLDESGELPDFWDDVLPYFDILRCPQCGRENHQENIDESDDMMSIKMYCQCCDIEYDISLTTENLMASLKQ